MKYTAKIISTVALTIFSISTFAQLPNTPQNAKAASMETANSDYVTTGSLLPYFVAPDNTINTMAGAGTMKNSIFNWTVTTSADAAIAGSASTVKKYDGTAVTEYNDFRTVTAGTGFYDNEIGILWDATYSAGTQYKVKVTEKSVTLSSTVAGCLSTTTVEKNVYVLPAATVAFSGTEGGGCTTSAGSSFYVPINVSGLGSWTVIYTISYNGAAAGADQTYTLTMASPAVSDATVFAVASAAKLAEGTPTGKTDGLKIDLPALQFGYYDIVIKDVKDIIAKKANNFVSLPTSPATGSYRIYVNPSPTTQSIQHVKNL
jgi:hypothetical protein